MKRFALLVSLILVAVLVVPSYAARPTPTPTATAVSWYFPFSFVGPESQVQDFTLLTVPEGKSFVLIEVLTKRTSNQNSGTYFTLLKDAESRFATSQDFELRLNSGMVVPSGSTVTIRANFEYEFQSTTDPASFSNGYIFASGYLQ